MFAVKPERDQVTPASCMDKISGFELEGRVPELGDEYLESLGIKNYSKKDRYFSIDFTDASVRKGDHCKITKTTEMRADEFWDELTAHSKADITRIITQAKLRGKTVLQSDMDHVQLMFKKPDVVFGKETLNMSSLLGSFRRHLAGFYSNLAVNQCGDVYFSDFSNLYKINYSTQERSGQITASSHLENKVASVLCFDRYDHLIAGGGVGSKSIKLIDTNISNELFSYQLSSPATTACLLAKQDSILAAVDDLNYIHLFDVRAQDPIKVLSNFTSSPTGSISTLQLENNQLLLGTSEGPILLPISEAITESVTLPSLESHRSSFLSKDLVATARFGAAELKLLNTTTGQKVSFNIPNEQITDLTVSGDKQTIAVVSVNPSQSKNYLRLIQKRGGEYEWTQYLKTQRNPYKVLFTKRDELMIADELNFQVYQTSNQKFVSGLKDKLNRYLK